MHISIVPCRTAAGMDNNKAARHYTCAAEKCVHLYLSTYVSDLRSMLHLSLFMYDREEGHRHRLRIVGTNFVKLDGNGGVRCEALTASQTGKDSSQPEETIFI